MTVYFIGAGPGAPDLITVRGLRLIERCPVCLYAGSLVPAELVAAAPKGALIVSASEDGTVRFWDAATGDPGRTLRAHAGTVRTVKFSPDGMWLATAGDDKTIRLTPVKP